MAETADYFSDGEVAAEAGVVECNDLPCKDLECNDQGCNDLECQGLEDQDTEVVPLLHIQVGTEDNIEEYALTHKEAYLSRLFAACLLDRGLEQEPTHLPLFGIKPQAGRRCCRYLVHMAGLAPQPIVEPLPNANVLDHCDARTVAFLVETFGGDHVDEKVEEDGGENRGEHTSATSHTMGELYDLMMAAQYTDIPSLVQLSSALVASIMKRASINTLQACLQPDAVWSL
jgi:hypothetical protein